MQSPNLLAITVNSEIQKNTQEGLLGRLNQSADRVVDISNCLTIYNSLQLDENFHKNFPNFKKEFFGKLGGVKELLHENAILEVSDVIIGGRAIKSELYNLKTQIQSFDDDSKRHFCAGLSELFLKNAPKISNAELAILEELNPNFYLENPNFKKQFLQKVGEEFNVLKKNVNFWIDNVEALTHDKAELRGYFCEGLSNALTQFQPKTAIGLQNSYQLYQLLSEKPVENLGVVGQFLLEFTQNKQSFAEDSKTKINENLESFPQKFATDFVNFLTNVNNENGKQEANALIEDICKSGSLELITEIKKLLDQNLNKNGVTGTAKGIQVIKIQEAFTRLGGQEEPLASVNQGGIILDDGSRLSSSQGVSKEVQRKSLLSGCLDLFACIRSDRERENGGGPVASQSLVERVNQTQQPALTNSMAGTASPSAQNIAAVASLVTPNSTRNQQ